MFAVLGEIAFTLPTYVDGMEEQQEYSYAEHDLIEGKPRLQWIADGLIHRRMEFVFNRAYCNPEEEMTRLREAAGRHQALPLVLGNGVHHGYFVITAIQSTVRQSDGVGTLVAISATVTLKEWVDDQVVASQSAAANNEGRTSGAVPIARQDRTPVPPTANPNDVTVEKILRS